jgi:endothelin-converting enzyme/putative endopeptidase
MRTASILLVLAGLAAGQETPLRELPYTPSLEMKFVDRSVNPCIDFYKYACGNWNKLNPMPADQSRWGVYGKMADENARYLWGILDEAAKDGAGRSPDQQKIGDYFAACMNAPAIQKAGDKPLSEGLAQIAALKSVHDVAAYVAREHKEGVNDNVLFNVDAEPDLDNSAQMMANLNAGGLGLPDRDYYTKTDAKSVEIRARYVSHVAQALQLTGETAQQAQADAATVLAIETRLARASLTRVEQRDPYKLKNRFTREKLRAFNPHFDWNAYWAGVGVPEFTELNVSQPQFFAALNEALTTTSLAHWKAYFRWRLVHAYAPYLAPAFEKSNFDFYSAYLRGLKAPPPRWKKCTRPVDRQLGEALGEVFVARTFTPATKQATLAMVQQVEAEMGSDIESLSWMSPATKKEALVKLNGILNKIGYPDKWRDYSALQIVPDDFAGNVKRADEFEERRTGENRQTD